MFIEHLLHARHCVKLFTSNGGFAPRGQFMSNLLQLSHFKEEETAA